MYTVITVILNANGFAIGSVVSLRQSQYTQRKSKFRERPTTTSEHSIIHQVFLILRIYVILIVIPIRGSQILSGILCRAINMQFTYFSSHVGELKRNWV